MPPQLRSLFREISGVLCERTLRNTPSQIVEFLNVTADDIYNYHRYVKGYVFNHFIHKSETKVRISKSEMYVACHPAVNCEQRNPLRHNLHTEAGAGCDQNAHLQVTRLF